LELQSKKRTFLEHSIKIWIWFTQYLQKRCLNQKRLLAGAIKSAGQVIQNKFWKPKGEKKMADTYTEVTRQSWGGRLKSSLQAALMGFLLFFGAFYVLFWNEGRAIHRAQTLDEGERAVITVDANFINPGDEGELIHLTGKATTDETLTDPMFGVTSANTIKLQRWVEMYQWKENLSSETEEEWGGSTETNVSYTYSKEWSGSLIDSTPFKQPAGHFNPPALPVNGELFTTEQVKLGEFTLSSSLVGKMNKYQPLPMTASMLEKVPKTLRFQSQNNTSALEGSRDNFHLYQGKYYIGQAPNHPQIGDVRVIFQVVMPTTISVIAQQRGSSLVTFVIEKTRGEIELFGYGTLTAKEMFEHEKMMNTIFTWLLRFGGGLMMYIGLLMIFNVLKILAAVIPPLSSIVGFIGSLVAFLISMVLSITTIAIAWLFYRPMLGILLLILAAIVLYLLKFVWKPQQESTTVPENTDSNWLFLNNSMKTPSFVSGNIWQSPNSSMNAPPPASRNRQPSMSACQPQRFRGKARKNGGTLLALDRASSQFSENNLVANKMLATQPQKSTGVFNAVKKASQAPDMQEQLNKDFQIEKNEGEVAEEQLAEEALRANHALKLIGF
jgi:hypothetical protein